MLMRLGKWIRLRLRLIFYSYFHVKVHIFYAAPYLVPALQEKCYGSETVVI
jgi:hypothetical protein